MMSQGVTKFTAEATKAKDKFFEGQTQEEQISYSSLWELPEPVEYCRECGSKFQLVKHHCRSCAGVFCDNCCTVTVPSPFEKSLIPTTMKIGLGQGVRLCLGCKKAECPGLPIKTKIRQLLEVETTDKSTKIEKFQMKVAGKLAEAVTTVLSESEHRSPVVALARGSYYGENGMPKKCGSKPLAMSGYFELYNKSNEVITVKLLKSGENVKFEIPRPSYMTSKLCNSIYTFP